MNSSSALQEVILKAQQRCGAHEPQSDRMVRMNLSDRMVRMNLSDRMVRMNLKVTEWYG